jgi:hypothetical protein
MPRALTSRPQAAGLPAASLGLSACTRTSSCSSKRAPLPVAIGSGETINFQPTGNGTAAITSDFVLTATEVNPVLRALHANGIE